MPKADKVQEFLPPLFPYGNLPRGRRQVEFHRYLHTVRHMPGGILKVQCLCHRTLLRGYGTESLILSAQCIGNRVAVCGNLHVSVVPFFRCHAVVTDIGRGLHVRNGQFSRLVGNIVVGGHIRAAAVLNPGGGGRNGAFGNVRCAGGKGDTV